MKAEDKQSQRAKILDALKKGQKLTTMGIIKRFRCVDARKRLSEIHQTNPLTKDWVEKNGKRFLQYSL